MGQLYHGDCVEILNHLSAESVDLVFADPPFNIGLKYDEHNDRMTPRAYTEWTDRWLDGCQRVLKPTGSIYVAIGDDYAAELGVALKKRFTMRNWIIWNFTFGQCTKKKFNRCKTHILYFVKGKEFVWNGDAIKVPSARQLKYNDKRAKAGGKMPDDVWDATAEEIALNERHASLGATPEGDVSTESEIPGDVWKISRLCGTFNERIRKEDGSVHPCQMPESVLERIIRVSSPVGGVVLDPFGGTGTTAAVAQRLGREWVTMDRSASYCEVISSRLFKESGRYVKFTPPLTEQLPLFG